MTTKSEAKFSLQVSFDDARFLLHAVKGSILSLESTISNSKHDDLAVYNKRLLSRMQCLENELKLIIKEHTRKHLDELN